MYLDIFKCYIQHYSGECLHNVIYVLYNILINYNNFLSKDILG